jgi:hypothetical protein
MRRINQIDPHAVARVRFAVNLDALSRSGVRVNPDVLMLARNPKHE